MKFILSFVYHYPLLMAFVWVLGSAIYRLRRAPVFRRMAPVLASQPALSVLIPCHNEEDCIRDTLARAGSLDYPDYEIIAIDDGSSDDTWSILQSCAVENPRLRVVHLRQNQGKAMALKAGLLVSRSEFLVCIDADAFLAHDALRWIMWHFVKFPRVGAVTGNPRIRNRSSLLGKIQVGEYSTIIGMIKRTQRILGKMFTVSGVAAAFRKRALLDVGLWSEDMITEDIDITWKLETGFWDVRYEENALCWILTPESIQGLWRQRLRWAQGGAEVMLKYSHALWDRRQRRFWPIYIEYFISMAWAYAFFFTVGVAVLNLILPLFDVHLPDPYSLATILPPEWTGTLLASVCMFQALCALLFERCHERGLAKYIFWFIWYPVVYWVLAAAACVTGLPLALMREKGRNAVWRGVDRGLQA